QAARPGERRYGEDRQNRAGTAIRRPPSGHGSGAALILSWRRQIEIRTVAPREPLRLRGALTSRVRACCSPAPKPLRTPRTLLRNAQACTTSRRERSAAGGKLSARVRRRDDPPGSAPLVGLRPCRSQRRG